MKSNKLFNILEGIDLDIANHPEFKEDSVREEIILPIIKGLGYTANKPNQIIRSRKLLHPFVSIGSQQKNIYIIPDYLFEVNDKPQWILDAKSPSEKITKSIHVEQAYSYAVHSDVRVKFFALCNGLEFALFDIEKKEPIFLFPLKAIPFFWNPLKSILTPESIVAKSPSHRKDLGLHLEMLGFNVFENLTFHNVPIMEITQMDPDFYTMTAIIVMENGEKYMASFDFGMQAIIQLQGKIPQKAYEILIHRKPGDRRSARFADRVFYLNIDCKIGSQLAESEIEIFKPLWVNSFLD